MGNTFSDNSQNSNIGRRARKMLNVRPGSNHTDHQTIKFSRGDLVNTVSSLDLNSVFEQHGGSKKIDLHNIPSRNRYDDYGTTKTMKPFAGGSRGVIGAVSSSNGDLSAIKNMIMGTQNGGSCGNPGTPALPDTRSAGCGCETNEVLQEGGKLDLASLLLLQNNLSEASTSYNPLNSMTPLHGGNLDLNSESELNILANSPIMMGGSNNDARRMFSVTSPFTETHNGLTATSPFNQSQMNQFGGGILSTTSYSDNEAFSATSAFNQSQMNQFGGGLSTTSALNQTQMGGALSATSNMPINYDMLIGGKNKNKNKKATIVKRSSASSSSTKSTSISSITRSSNPSSSTIMNDMDDSSESTESESESNEDDIIARALKSDHHENVIRRDLSRLSSDKHVNKEKKHSKKSSDSSSSSTITASASTSTNDTSKSGSTSATTISSSETPNEAIAKVGMARFNNILLTSPNNDTVSDSLINAKQFYSSDHGDLYSSPSNFLRNRINQNRLR